MVDKQSSQLIWRQYQPVLSLALSPWSGIRYLSSVNGGGEKETRERKKKRKKKAIRCPQDGRSGPRIGERCRTAGVVQPESRRAAKIELLLLQWTAVCSREEKKLMRG